MSAPMSSERPRVDRRIAVLLTCFNRREKTVACLERLKVASEGLCESLHVYLVDDGSTDGTSEAVAARFPEVHLACGDGSLYWAGGMRRAFYEAEAEGPHDFILWLNDDTHLDPDALRRLLATYDALATRGEGRSIVVGSTRDPETGELTYGGLVRSQRWHPLRFERLPPGDEPRRCHAMNGNCVLIPAAVTAEVGNLGSEFRHAMGDVDYALRAAACGISTWVAPGFVGTCGRNSARGTWLDTSLSLRERLKKVRQPKGLPPAEWKALTRKHAGPFWPLFFLTPYSKLLVAAALTSVRRSVDGGR